MNDTTSVLDQEIVTLLGMQGLTPIEQEAFIAQIGSTVMSAVLVDFSASLNEGQQTALEHYLETEPATEVMLEHLIKSYPTFSSLLEKHVTTLKSEMIEATEGLEE